MGMVLVAQATSPLASTSIFPLKLSLVELGFPSARTMPRLIKFTRHTTDTVIVQ